MFNSKVICFRICVFVCLGNHSLHSHRMVKWLLDEITGLQDRHITIYVAVYHIFILLLVQDAHSDPYGSTSLKFLHKIALCGRLSWEHMTGPVGDEIWVSQILTIIYWLLFKRLSCGFEVHFRHLWTLLYSEVEVLISSISLNIFWEWTSICLVLFSLIR